MREDIDPISEFLPEEGWLGEYVKFTSGMEACARFNFFSAACVLGAAINNRCWIVQGDPELLAKRYPNIWVLLLAPPGRGHKTSVINVAANCLTSACDEVRILADKLTPEYLVKALATPVTDSERIRIGPRDATGLIRAPELSVFFGKQQYNIGLVSLITSLYDAQEEWSSASVGRGGEKLSNVCISILGGSTPVWLHQMLPQDAFTGGFMSRFVLVEMPIDYFKKVTFPSKPPDTSWLTLVDQLSELSQINGEMAWGNGSKECFEEIDEGYGPTGEEQIDAYRVRESEQILKLSMLIAISNHRNVLEQKDIEQANNIVQMLEKETKPRIERLTTHPNMQLVQDIKDLLSLKGEMKEEDLLRSVYRTLGRGERQFYEAISIMKNAKLIDYEGTAKDGYRYKLKRRIIIK